MARLPIHSFESATGSNKDIFAALQKGLGLVPNMTRVMANSPAVLQSFELDAAEAPDVEVLDEGGRRGI